MRQSYLALDKYLVTQSGYFRLATTVALVMGIKDVGLLYFHGVAEESEDNKIPTLEYNSRTVYECFNNPFKDDFGSPSLNLPPITFDDIPRLHKRARYTSDLLPASISVASKNYFSTFTTPSDYPDILPSDGPNPLRVMKMYVTVLGRVHIRYCCRKQDKKIYKNTRFYCSTCSDKNKKILL